MQVCLPSFSCQNRWPSRAALLSISRLERGLPPAAAAQASYRARMDVTTGRILALTCAGSSSRPWVVLCSAVYMVWRSQLWSQHLSDAW